MEERNELEKPFLETQGGSDGSIEIRAVPPVISRVYTASSCPEFPDFLPDKLPKLPEVQHVLARRRTSLRRLRYRLASEIPGTSSEHQSRDLPIQRDSDMRSDFRRYKSFRKYNDPWPAPVLFLQSSLADAGFYYVGPGDRVRCFSCGGELDNWEDWDVPLTRHQLSFPDCPNVLELRAEMSPIFGQYQYQGKESLLFPMSERLSQTVPSSSNCPTVQGLIKDPDYSKVESITEGESETSAPPSGSSISGQKPLGTMSDENNRLETYRGHRHHFPYNNQRSLSWAGFYYVGPGDRVRCFSCGGELENWQPGDVPLTRHRRSFPDCPNVLELRAEMFPIFCQYQYLRKESPLLPMSMRLSPTVPSSSNCPTVQGQIKDPDYSKVESITEGESETSAPPSGSSISGQKPLGTMSDENNRLETYRGHRHHFPYNNQRSLSWAGFYYVGPGDRVRCFSCGGELENWQPGDVPLTRHLHDFPDCPNVLELRAEVSPIFCQYQYLRKESPLLPMSERLSPTVPSSSNCPTVQGQIKDPDYSKVESITEGESETSAPPSGSSISGQKPLGTMSDEHNRLETYRGHCHHFPHHNRQSLSRAGFYYVGPGDRVRCFSCGGELENWEFRDDPLTRHRLSFPDCPYVLERRAKTLPILCRSQTVFASAFLGLSLIDFSSSHRPRPLSDQDTPMSLHMRNEGERFHSPVTSSSVTRCLKSDSANQEEVASGQEEELGFGQAEGGASGQAEEMDSVGHREQTEETCDWPRGSAEECELCGKASEFPQIRPERTGTKFRLVVPREGLFRCSETGLQFRVESPANIDIEIGSWVEFRGHLHQYTYDIVGPLFNITVKSGRVSAVYLPHYVCLKGGDVDKAMFRVAHYKDDNMILESPTRVEPFYVVLENPTFSPVGVIKLQPSPNGRRRKIPTHGVVMLYSRYKTGYTIHLYLMPRDLSLKQAVHNKETENGFYRVDKPPQTSTIYTEKIYIVGGPEDADIIPEELKLCLDDKSELYPYSEIYLEEIQDKIYLQLTCQGENTSTWRTQLRTEDLETKTKVTQDGRHFIDRHRAALIANMSHIDPVLDDLLGDKILTQEQYDTVRSKSTSQEKMRQLYDCIKTWGNADKDVFYFTLSVHNKSLIKELLHS